MSLSIGIVGLPNVGKSTVFNALTRTQKAEVANYPFCTIQPNRAVVPVPDERVEKLAELVGVGVTIHATIEFVDIAGLVKGASKGEGLGNQFLGNIRDTDAILHIVRCFEDPNVVHVSEKPEPRADIEVINVELMLADLQQLERKLEKLERQAKHDKKMRPQLKLAQDVQAHLQEGNPITSYSDRENPAFQELNKEMRFLTSKPVITVANVDESDLEQDNQCMGTVRQVATEMGAQVVKLCAKLEQEMAGMTDEERQEFLEMAGAEEGGLEQTIRKSYDTLGLISFFTMNEEQVRAWEIPRGFTASQAAGVIHTDFERGFIRAEVIPFETFVQYGSVSAARAAGAMRIEGKDYIVQDGEVIYIRFNV